MSDTVTIPLSVRSIDDYRKFIAIKRLPRYRFSGGSAIIPAEYAAQIGVTAMDAETMPYTPSDILFDYQRAITAWAVRKRKAAIFADCGLGKTLMLLDYARHVSECEHGRPVLILTPLMVIEQMMSEACRFFPSMDIHRVPSRNLASFLTGGSGVGICNYEGLHEDTPRGRLAGLILDESSMLKSDYGHWGQQVIRLGKGLRWKLALTGTPAPNDRTEFANHAVFLDILPTVNSFYARYFVNRGDTSNRWELKPHAVKPFYRDLASWSVFIARPHTYGFKDNSRPLPPINIHIHDVPLTRQQREAVQLESGALFATEAGGIVNRAKLSQLAKGKFGDDRIPTHKPQYIRDLVGQWIDRESTIIWCIYNHEQDTMEKMFPDAVSIAGPTPYDDRLRMISDFKAGRTRVLISKPKVLGFGLNLQVATRQVFSGLQDSYESFYQAVKRSNRFGALYPLNVHIPVTELERPMVDSVLNKSSRIEQDTAEQENMFREVWHSGH